MYPSTAENDKNKMCRGCLSKDRHLVPIRDQIQLYCTLISKEEILSKDIKYFDILLCWECMALLRKIKLFQQKIQNAQHILQSLHSSNDVTLSPLTSLCISHQEYYTLETEEAVVSPGNSNCDQVYNLVIENVVEENNDVNIKEEFKEDDHMPIEINVICEPLEPINQVELIKSGESKGRFERRVKITKRDIDFDNVESYFTKIAYNKQVMEEINKGEEYKCNSCNKGFRSREHYEAHYKAVHVRVTNMSVICNECHMILPSRSAMVTHWRYYHSIYECNECHSMCRTLTEMRRHLNTVHTMDYTCLDCHKTCGSFRGFIQHYKLFHTKYECDYCGVKTRSKMSLVTHIRRSHSTLECRECDKKFNTLQSYDRHFKISHPDRLGCVRKKVTTSREPSYCVQCDRQFTSIYYYKRHLATNAKHVEYTPREKCSIPCPTCEKVFDNKHSMREHHSLFHTEQPRHHCDSCDKGNKMSTLKCSCRNRRALWSEDSLRAAMNAVQRGELSQRAAGIKYKIPRRTLRNHLETGVYVKRLGRRPVLTDIQKQAVCTRIERLTKVGVSLASKFKREDAQGNKMSKLNWSCKKRRALWSEDSLKAAMNAVQSGQLSQHAAVIKYKIPRRTLRNHLETGECVKRLGRRPILTDIQEQDLCTRIERFAKVGVSLTSRFLRGQAFLYCERYGIKHNFNISKRIAGPGWLRHFLERNPSIRLREPQAMNPVRAQQHNKFIVRQHFQRVRELYDELDILQHPERLFNMGVKVCRTTVDNRDTVLVEKGNEGLYLNATEHVDNVTIAMCVNAIGNAIPPMILFKGHGQICDLSENLPAGTMVKMVPKGNMTADLFVEFIQHLAKHKVTGKCLLIFDDAKCHLSIEALDEADKNNIVLYCLPSNTAYELQPLNKTVNKSYDNYWNEELVNFLCADKALTNAIFNKTFSRVWSKCMMHGDIVNGFKATGLFPFDPEAIPDAEASVPTGSSEIPCPQDRDTPPHDPLSNALDVDIDIDQTIATTPTLAEINSVDKIQCQNTDASIHKPIVDKSIYLAEDIEMINSLQENHKTIASPDRCSHSDEDNIPLVNLKQNTRIPFQDVLSTPKYAIVNSQRPHKSALNYRGQIITVKNLFNGTDVK